MFLNEEAYSKTRSVMKDNKYEYQYKHNKIKKIMVATINCYFHSCQWAIDCNVHHPVQSTVYMLLYSQKYSNNKYTIFHVYVCTLDTA